MNRFGPQPVARLILPAAALAVVGVAVLVPLYTVVRDAAMVGGVGGIDAQLLLGSFGIAAVIGALATLLAWPAAWCVRRRGGAWLVVVASPMLLPSYLAYTGWGVLRAPDTALGRWLMHGGPGGSNWYPIAAGYVLAVAGLVLWSWPLAAMVITARVRQLDDSVIDALGIDVRSTWRRWAEVAWMCRGSLAAGFGLVLLVMMGSAVPLHLAQLDTYAIELWRALDRTGRDAQWQVWARAWPLMGLAVAGAVLVSRRMSLSDGGGDRASGRTGRSSRVGRWASPVLIVVWCLSVLLPTVLLAGNVRNWSNAGQFWGLIQGPLWNSAQVAAIVGATVAFLGVCSWLMLEGRQRRAVVLMAMVLLVMGLAPGILVGAATARSWVGTRVGDSGGAAALAHVARFGFLGVLAGWWLATTEVQSLRDLRELDAGGSLLGWALTALAPRAGIVAAAGLAGGLLSFHEIEATVMVQPASSWGGAFAWQMLQWLHFVRMDELGMGVGLVIAGGMLVACAAAWAWSASNRV